MDTTKNIIRHLEERRLLHKDVANAVGVDCSTYSKMEKVERVSGMAVNEKTPKLLGLTIDEPVYSSNQLLKDVNKEGAMTPEKIQLMSLPDKEDLNALYRIIGRMLAKNRSQTSFQQNIAVK
jgi:hypothetical protein